MNWIAMLLLAVSMSNVAAAQSAPSHYVFYSRDRDALRRDSLFFRSRGFEGAQISYPWRQLEPRKDEYDFSLIREDLALLRKEGKKLWIQLQDVSFTAQYIPVPQYLLDDAQYNGGAARQYRVDGEDESKAVGEGWAMRRWDPSVQARFHRLLIALGREFDGQVEGINFAETSVTFGESGRLFPSGFSHEGYRDAIITNMRALKQAFPKSVTLIYGNFMPGEWRPTNDRGYLAAVYKAARALGVGVGGPDLMPHRRGQRLGAYPLMREASADVPVGIAVQDGNLAEVNPTTKKRVGAAELLDFAIANLHARYIFWGIEEPFYSTEVVPLVTHAQTRPLYRDAAQPIDTRVRDLLGRMTLDEKFWQLYMIPGSLDDSTHDYRNGVFGLQVRMPTGTDARAHTEKLNRTQRYFVEQTRLGIPMLAFEEAVHGLLAEDATVFPVSIGLAATWDTALMGRVARAIARETGSRGIRDVLAPVINIAADPRWGRTEETYGEDAVLSSGMGVAFVRAFEQANIIATPKHFIANVGDGGRDSYPIDLNRRLLEEVHFPPFVSAIREGGARSVMTSYNSVDGSPATQNRWLLNDVLKRDWGFRGFVISDQAATGGATVLHNTEASNATATKNALDAGLDVIFQSSWPQHRSYLAALRNGTIADSVIDAAVARVLRAKFELGLFERPYANPDSAAHWNGHADHIALALESARASIVLLKNDRNTLPLARGRSIAVIGADANEARLGGYSGSGIKPVTILEGIRNRARGSAVNYAEGPGRLSPEFVVVPAEQLALRGEYFDNTSLTGAPRFTRDDKRVDFSWTFNEPGPGIPTDWYSVRWTGRITAPASGVRRLGVEGNDGYRLYVDGRLVIDNWQKQSFRVTLSDVRFAPGSVHDIKLEYFESTGNTKLKLVWDAGVPNDWRAKIDSAVALAKRSSVAVVVAGVEEGEFRDRAKLSLPGHQEELIERVAATGTPTVVVLVGGSAITGGRWMDSVAAVLTAWYPGEQGGNAIADVLFGDYNPAGRLPITWPRFEGQLPLVYNHKPTGRGDDYVDMTGQPLFPFGFGLSYTTFEYSGLAITPGSIGPNDTTTVRLRVKNTGVRAGDEVVQFYVRDLLASVARPVIQLQHFQRIHLAPGEEKEVTFKVGPDQLRMLDRDLKWIVEPGTFRILVGASSKDIRLRGDLVVVNAPSETGTALLTAHGWGPLRIGMTRAQVVAAAGNDANPVAVGGPNPAQCDEFRPERAPAGLLVMIERDTLTRISVSRNANITTASGIRVGDSTAAVMRAYGVRAEVTPHKYQAAPARYITVWENAAAGPSRRGILYEIDATDKVRFIRGGGASIQYVEGCL